MNMPFAVRVVLLFALAVSTLGAGPRSAIEPILDAMRTAAGPVWNAHFVSISRLSFEGTTSTVSSESQGIPFTLRRCNGELCEGTYFDGERLFTVNVNDTALPQSSLPEPYLRSLRILA